MLSVVKGITNFRIRYPQPAGVPIAIVWNLIAASPKKLAAFLQLIKETAMRCGEAIKVRWTDIDFEKQIITLNEPEKGSEPGIWKVSTKLVGMLNTLPRKSLRVFGDGPINSLKTTYLKMRKRWPVNFKTQSFCR